VEGGRWWTGGLCRGSQGYRRLGRGSNAHVIVEEYVAREEDRGSRGKRW